MKSFLKALTVVAATSFVSTANAGFISGEQSFQDVNGNSKSVNLSGLEWLSLDHTLGMSRDDIDGKDWTDTKGNSWNSNEWRYATRAETNALINSLWGGTYDGVGYNNYQGANWFADHFGMVSGTADGWTNYQRSYFFYGAAGDCSTDPTISCSGRIYKADDADTSLASYSVNRDNTTIGYNPFVHVLDSSGAIKRAQQGFGYISQADGNAAVLSDAFLVGQNATQFDWVSTRDVSFSSSSRSSLLVRNVSEPSTILLFSMSLLGLGIRARRKVKA